MLENQLTKIRHALSHLLASAALEMFPEAKLGIGPAIENGFYYDFDLPRTLIPEDLPILEEKMRALIKKSIEFQKYSEPVDEAVEFWKKAKQPYKVELAQELAKEKKEVSFYRSGDFVDLCEGPHIKSTKEIPANAFKIDKIAGAYWRGSEKNKMLQRIYGLAFESKDKLDEYLKNREEAEKRDHRKLGKELDLFHIDDKVGLGLVLWHPRGAKIWRAIENFWFEEHEKAGYELVKTPHIGNQKIWETSGHWDFYNESMYPPLEAGQNLKEVQQGKKVENSEQYLLKPMNCPFHIQIYNNALHSYRELPFRWAEPGTVYRFEKTGELSGLTRVRGFTQDDAHIICRKNQVEEELRRVVDFIFSMYHIFGFSQKQVNIYLSLQDPKNKEKYSGNDEGWNFTENVLRKIADGKKLKYQEEIGEAAFYGPKLDFKIKDILGREWQCATLQFDFNLPNRFDMKYINEEGKEERPYVLHRTLLGSFERFIGLLIEHYAGAFPLWLTPVQAIIIPVSEKFEKYGQKVYENLKKNGIRVEIDNSNESVSKRIRNSEIQKIPYILVTGEKEEKDETVAVREQGKREVYSTKVDKFIRELNNKITTRA